MAGAAGHRGGTCITDGREESDETLRRSQVAPLNGCQEAGREGGTLSADPFCDALFAHDPRVVVWRGRAMEG